MTGELALYLIFLLILLGFSAFFSASETAIFSLSSLNIAEFRKGKSKAGLVIVSLLKTPRRLLITILFGNTLVNILFFSVSTVLGIYLKEELGKSAYFLVAVASVTLVILFGEVLPKAIAIKNPIKISLTFSYMLMFFFKAFRQIINVFDCITKKLTQISQKPKSLTSKELKYLFYLNKQEGILKPKEHEMLLEVLDIQKIRVQEVMIPRVEMIKISQASTRSEILEKIRFRKPKKISVYEKEEPIGIIQVKNFFLYPDLSLEELLEKIRFVPENMKVESLLKFLKEKNETAAFVVDEYGGIAGLVTLESLVEELIGDTSEEEMGISLIEKKGENEFHVSGLFPLKDLSNIFLGESESYPCNTISGLVTLLLQRFPQVGDCVKYENLQIKVLEVHRHRVGKASITN